MQPDLGGEGRADRERVAPQRPPVDEDFELQAFEVEVDPVELAPRHGVAQRLERDDAARERPVVLVRGARGRGLFERLPERALAPASRLRSRPTG